MNRRHFLTTGVSICGVGITGCLNDDNGSDENNSGTESEGVSSNDSENEDETESCELASREEQGTAEPIERSAIKDDSGCGIQAAAEVIDYLDEHLDIELANASWISPAYSKTDEQAVVSVYAQGRSSVEGDGEITTCPDPEWDFDDALEVLPSEITLILTNEDKEKQDECSHEVVLEQGTMWLD